MVNNFRQQKRYEVVFDDFWKVKDWEAIKHMLPDKNCGSRVILTTRFANIASTYCKEIDGNIYTLFEGLPLAIIAISGVLATKDKSKIDEWEMLYRSLGAELEGNAKLDSERAKHCNNNLQTGLKEAEEDPLPIDSKHLK
ncbi:hypothetical protein ACSBR2_014144 [Camellia fascicularis]